MSALTPAGHKSLLQLIQDACAEIGIIQPPQVIGSIDPTVKQLLALANREGQEMHAIGTSIDGWQMLRREFVWQVVGGQDTYALPADADMLIPGTAWDRSMRWQLLGPATPQEWQVLKSAVVPLGPRRRWRVLAGQFVLFPVPSPTDNNTLVYEYYSNCWCQSANNVPQPQFAADTDTYLLDDNVMVLGIIWRYRRKKGLEFSIEYEDWKRARDRAIASQAGMRDLSLTSGSGLNPFISTANIPDTGYGNIGS
ncbi:hypothetical protein [Chromobacterium subtsugae]|uniref:phage adaptor protein n=1 Tax=Chromobacterium subtsugae TaxID=251747 RepID=UPI0007F8D414|nr:hypothetical protein [Chromobacterium subtsugae]OBU84580.1 hypothetical protein MY55_21370 [Chromobacterium subtsugae]